MDASWSGFTMNAPNAMTKMTTATLIITMMRVGLRAFANSVDQKDCHCCHDEQRGEIKRDGVTEQVRQTLAGE